MLVGKGVQEAVVAAAPLAVAYFGGWSYLSSYLNLFGIDPTETSIPVDVVLVYAFRTLSNWVVILMVSVSIIMAILIIKLFPREIRRVLTNLLACIVLIGTLFTINCVSGVIAQDVAQGVWHDKRPKTSAEVEPLEGSYYLEDYRICRQAKRLNKVIGFDDRMFLLCRSQLQPCLRGAVYEIDRSGRIVARTEIRRRALPGESECPQLG